MTSKDPASLSADAKVPLRTLHVGGDAINAQLAAITFSSENLIAAESDELRGPGPASGDDTSWSFLDSSNAATTVLTKVATGSAGAEFGRLNILPKLRGPNNYGIETTPSTYKVRRTNSAAVTAEQNNKVILEATGANKRSGLVK